MVREFLTTAPAVSGIEEMKMNSQIVIAHMGHMIKSIRAALPHSGSALISDIARLHALEVRYDELKSGVSNPWPDEVRDAQIWAASRQQ